MNISAGLVQAWQYHHTGFVVTHLSEEIKRYKTLLGYIEDFVAYGLVEQFQRMVGISGISCDLVQLINPKLGNRIELIEVHDVPQDAPLFLPVHPGMAHTAYFVPDIEAASQQVTKNGGFMLDKIVEFSEGNAAYFHLPGGSIIELEELKSESE